MNARRLARVTASTSLLVVAILLPFLAPPLCAQSVPDTTLALLPAEAGELAYADLRALRQSPHYRVLHDSYLPDRLRQLEAEALSLGIDFEAQAQQLSWAYVAGQGGVDLISVAEGNFSPSQVAEKAQALKLPVSKASGQTVIGLGKNDLGQEFAITFPTPGKLVFGTRTQVESLLARAASGAPGILQNQTLAPLLAEANGRNPIWSVMDQRFAVLEIQNAAPAAASRPEAQTLLNGLRAAIARATLGSDLSSSMTFLCMNTSEAQLLGAVAQAGFTLTAIEQSTQNADLAAALRSAVVEQQGDRVDVKLNLTQPQLVTLLAHKPAPSR
jgi:hypothetical protein